MSFTDTKNFNNKDEIVRELMLMILTDTRLSTPVFLHEVKSVSDGESLGSSPVVYVWNEDPKAGSYTLSVNGTAIASLLESVIPRSDNRFEAVTETVFESLLQKSLSTVTKICEDTGELPSALFAKR